MGALSHSILQLLQPNSISRMAWSAIQLPLLPPFPLPQQHPSITLMSTLVCVASIVGYTLPPEIPCCSSIYQHAPLWQHALHARGTCMALGLPPYLEIHPAAAVSTGALCMARSPSCPQYIPLPPFCTRHPTHTLTPELHGGCGVQGPCCCQ